MCQNAHDPIKDQAILLARENKKAEPTIEKVYWLPALHEVHLVELDQNVACSMSVEPFYFDPSPTDNLPAPSGIAIIRPEEFGKIPLPGNWGDWNQAEELELELEV